MNGRVIAALSAGALIGGTALTASHWEAIDKENNAFAKGCNDRDGVVIFGMQARQYLGTSSTKETK